MLLRSITTGAVTVATGAVAGLIEEGLGRPSAHTGLGDGAARTTGLTNEPLAAGERARASEDVDDEEDDDDKEDDDAGVQDADEDPRLDRAPLDRETRGALKACLR